MSVNGGLGVSSRSALPGAAGVVAGLAGVVALFGTYWDDAWHTDRGRDEFFIAPHLTLYAGVTLTGLVTAWWLARVFYDAGGGVSGVQALWRAPAALLALIGATATLLSAPVDNIWHELYGRDAVLWSPPHMLGVAGSVAMSVGLLAGLRPSRGRTTPVSRLLLGAGVLGSLLVPVLEFDSDVPQFPAWSYWPVTTAGLVLFLLVLRDLVPGRWAATASASAYTLAKILIVVALGVMDHSGSLVPPVLLVALLDDVLARRGVPALLRGLAVGALVPPAWSLAVLAQPGQATQVPGDQAVLGTLLSVLAAVAVVAASGRWRAGAGHFVGIGPDGLRLATVLVLLPFVVVMAASEARAHDPGQGEPAGQVTFDVRRSPTGAVVTAQVRPAEGGCEQLRPQAGVARRAGEQVTARLELQGCAARYNVDLPEEGRWFLYLTFDDTSGTAGKTRVLESWVPLNGAEDGVVATRDLYARRTDADRSAGAVQIAAGVALYVMIAGLMIASVRLARRTATPPTDGGADPSTSRQQPSLSGGIARRPGRSQGTDPTDQSLCEGAPGSGQH